MSTALSCVSRICGRGRCFRSVMPSGWRSGCKETPDAAHSLAPNGESPALWPATGSMESSMRRRAPGVRGRLGTVSDAPSALVPSAVPTKLPGASSIKKVERDVTVLAETVKHVVSKDVKDFSNDVKGLFSKVFK